MSNTYYTLSQQGKEADIYIFGDITSFPYAADHKSAGGLIREIQQLDADVINIHIDSYGGSVKEGWGMYSALKEHRAKVNTYADGFVASAALYPYLAGDNRYASVVSAFFLHEVSVGVYGYAEDLRDAADEAEKMTDIGINAFVESAGMTAETVKELMQKETWLDPTEALEHGIVTSIITTTETQRHTQSVRKAILQALRNKPPVQVADPAGDPGETNTFSFAKMFASKGE
ncbi:MAG: Clp protease ClpP [Oscillospiraceae bacterium]|nr:Clp protease ClpP [Oscillospiraceae bacterium]